MLIENDGAIFRGPARAWPKEVWDPKEKRFVPYEGNVPKDIDWGNEIDEESAKVYIDTEKQR